MTCNNENKEPLIVGNETTLNVVLSMIPEGGEHVAGAQMEFTNSNPLDVLLGGLQVFERVVRDVYGDEATEKALVVLNSAIEAEAGK